MQSQEARKLISAKISSPKNFSLYLLAILVAALLAVSPLSAQRYLGAITGQVSDASGARIPGAKVSAVETATHFKTDVVAGSDGTYLMPALQPGTYTLTITAPNFGTETRNNVVLTAGQTFQQDITLQPGTVSQTVVVQSATSLIDTSSPTIATTLSTQEVADLPNEGRNPYVQVALAPGVIPSTGTYFTSKSSQYTNPYSGFAVAVTTDGISGHNRLTLDGIPNDAAERFSGASYTNFVPSPEAVQETKVENGVFDAQVGHGDGTVTNVVVRTGTNKIHGSAYSRLPEHLPQCKHLRESPPRSAPQ